MGSLGGLNTMNDIFISGQEDAYFNSITCVDMSCNNISLTGALEIPDDDVLPDGNGVDVSLLVNGTSSFLGQMYYYNNLICGPFLTFSTTYNTQLNVLGTTNITQTQLAFLANVSAGQIGQAQILNGYVDLTGTQTVTGGKTWTSTHQFTGYVIPRLGTSNSLRLGNQSQQYQVSTLTTAYNITFGANSLRGNATNPTWNKCKRNVVIGTNAGQSLTYDAGNDALPSDDNVIIGHNCAPNAFYNSTQNVLIGSQVGKNNFIKNCVLIGYNVAGGAGASYNLQNCVVIGANTAPNFSDKGSVVCIGSDNNFLANSFTVVGQGNLTSATQGNRICILGSNNLNNISGADAFSIALGNDNGNSQNGASSFYNGYWGYSCNCDTGVNGSFTLGINSFIPRSNIFYIGSHHNISQSDTYMDLCLANKVSPFVVSRSGTGTSMTVDWEMGEFIQIESSNIATIYLPTIDTTTGDGRYNLGARFTFIKTYTSYPWTGINIYPATGQDMLISSGQVLPASGAYYWADRSNIVKFIAMKSNTAGLVWMIEQQGVTLESDNPLIYGNKTWNDINTFKYDVIIEPAGDLTCQGGANFSNPPVMSGANIATGSIELTSINANLVTTDTSQTITLDKTFTGGLTALNGFETDQFLLTDGSVLNSQYKLTAVPSGTNIHNHIVTAQNDSAIYIAYSQQSTFGDVTATGFEKSTILFANQQGAGSLQSIMGLYSEEVSPFRPITAQQGIYVPQYRLALTGNTSLTDPKYAGSVINIASSTGAYILTLPAATFSTTYGSGISYGNNLNINNNSPQILTLSSTSTFGNFYGTGATTWQLAPYQNVELYADGTLWSVYRVGGTPLSYSQYHNTTQSIPNATNTSVQFNTTNNQTWLNGRLTYALSGSEYRFTYGGTPTITVQVTVYIAFAANTTGVRRAWFQNSNAIYGAGQPIFAMTTPAFNLAGSYTEITLSATFQMSNTNYFSVWVYQNSGGALNISPASPRSFIQITRL